MAQSLLAIHKCRIRRRHLIEMIFFARVKLLANGAMLYVVIFGN
jgi:hypothetical protein